MVDVSCLDPIPWDEADKILGLDRCNNVEVIDKPEFEIDAEDRAKLNALNISGTGDSALYNDGTYKPTLTTDQVEMTLGNFVTVGEFVRSLADVVEYGNNGSIEPQGNIDLKTIRYIRAIAPDGNKYAAIENAADRTIFGALQRNSDIRSQTRPNVQTVNSSEQMAYLSDVTTLDNRITPEVNELTERVDSQGTVIRQLYESMEDTDARIFERLNGAENNIIAITTRVDTNQTNISTNTAEIASLRSAVENQTHFRGIYQTTAEITRLTGTVGDFAWNLQTNTVWNYTGATPQPWQDTGTEIPNQAISAYDSLPQMDGDASAGAINEYARGDHRHPTDTSRASVFDLAGKVNIGDVYSIDATDRLLSQKATDANTVHRTGNEVIGGIKTFVSAGSTVPTPTQPNEIANKAYVDNSSTTINGTIDELRQTVTGIDGRVTSNGTNITSNTESIATVNQTLNGKENISNKVAISSTAGVNDYPTAQSVWELVQEVAGTIPSGGLKVPMSIELESELPPVATLEQGDLFYVQNMDVTYPERTGRVWVNYVTPSDPASGLQYYRIADQYLAPDNISIIQTGAGALEVSDTWLDTFVSDALVPVTEQIDGVQSELSASIQGVSVRVATLEEQVPAIDTRVTANATALSGKVDNGGGVSAIQVFTTEAEAAEFSAANPTVLCIAVS